MLNKQMRASYERWLARATEDADLVKELHDIAGDDAALEDRFYRQLAFGTGGLRGVIGAGDNRMNIYTVRRATQGLADYLNLKYPPDATKSVAISFDSRIKSDLFASEAARVLAANGITVYIFTELNPTPVLSFAVRELGCQAGIMVTASHNPSKYNGYKCYGADGCQMTDHDADEVTACIQKVDIFDGVKTANYAEAVSAGQIRLLTDALVDAFLKRVAAQQINPGICAAAPLKVVYTPLNGTGNKPVREILKRIGVSDVTVVPSQELPDGNFPTAPYPNPEIREAFNEALKLAETVKPDLLLATDPDSDRVGIAVRKDNDYVLMSGNEVGCLLLNYILSCRASHGDLPQNPIAVKTIVSTELAAKIAQSYGCEIVSLLTGFKYIGEQITKLEEIGQTERYVFGFEESYGYLAGAHVRDKDAVVAAMLICEMAAFYRKQDKSLLDVMQGLYEQFGYYAHITLNVEMEGAEGMANMSRLMESLRTAPPADVAGLKVVETADYQLSVKKDIATGETQVLTLPKSNVLSFVLESGEQVIVRPSGTEPKIKAYITGIGADKAAAEAKAKALADAAAQLLK